MRMEKEPVAQNEIACSFCGPGKNASWKVALTEGKHAWICYRDYNGLLSAELILTYRRIGEIVWEEVQE